MPQVTISINETDTYGDGWQGQWVRIFDDQGTEVAAHTLEGGASGVDSVTLDEGSYTWTFGEGSWIEESSFNITRDDTGEVLASANGVSASGSFTLGEAPPAPAPELVGHWTFDSGDATASVGNDGANSGASFSTVDGREVATFDGSSHIEVDGADYTFAGEAFTVAFWFYSTGAPSEEWDMVLGNQISDGTTNGWGFQHYLQDPGEYSFQSGNGSGTWSNDHSSTMSIPTGEWVHVTLVRSGTVVKGYLNGQDTGYRAPVYGTIIYSQDTLYIGNKGGGVGGINAHLDSLRIYTGAMSDAEVQTLFEGPAASSYQMTLLDSATDAPSGDAGFEKGSEDGFRIHSTQEFSVWFRTNGAWDHHEGSYTGGMTFDWPADTDRAYVQETQDPQYCYKTSRELADGYMYDSDDADSALDKFKATGVTFDVSEHSVTVSGTNDISIGVSSEFVQVIEAGAISSDYSVTTGENTVVSPPSGKDGVAILIRIFSVS